VSVLICPCAPPAGPPDRPWLPRTWAHAQNVVGEPVGADPLPTSGCPATVLAIRSAPARCSPGPPGHPATRATTGVYIAHGSRPLRTAYRPVVGGGPKRSGRTELHRAPGVATPRRWARIPGGRVHRRRYADEAREGDGTPAPRGWCSVRGWTSAPALFTWPDSSLELPGRTPHSSPPVVARLSASGRGVPARIPERGRSGVHRPPPPGRSSKNFGGVPARIHYDTSAILVRATLPVNDRADHAKIVRTLTRFRKIYVRNVTGNDYVFPTVRANKLALLIPACQLIAVKALGVAGVTTIGTAWVIRRHSKLLRRCQTWRWWQRIFNAAHNTGSKKVPVI
jgi:hypothetical protein